jgi:hypothetical protein
MSDKQNELREFINSCPGLNFGLIADKIDWHRSSFIQWRLGNRNMPLPVQERLADHLKQWHGWGR